MAGTSWPFRPGRPSREHTRMRAKLPKHGHFLSCKACLQVYLRAHMNLWGESRLYVQAIQALALGDARACARVLSLAAGTLPTQHIDSRGPAEEEVQAYNHLELCETVCAQPYPCYCPISCLAGPAHAPCTSLLPLQHIQTIPEIVGPVSGSS